MPTLQQATARCYGVLQAPASPSVQSINLPTPEHKQQGARAWAEGGRGRTERPVSTSSRSPKIDLPLGQRGCSRRAILLFLLAAVHAVDRFPSCESDQDLADGWCRAVSILPG